MKLLLGRASVVLFFALLLVFGLLIFTAKYLSNASTWVHYPTNQHLYAEGKLLSCGTIYDRRGNILCQMGDGGVKFHADRAVRTAVLHATGDLYDNVMTGARVAFRDRLSGWDMINGVYNFRKQGRPAGSNPEPGCRFVRCCVWRTGKPQGSGWGIQLSDRRYPLYGEFAIL